MALKTATIVPPISIGGRYNLLQQLVEQSGPGSLFRARDTHLGRTVAIRLLPPGVFPNAVARNEVLQRARSILTVSHPNVTAVFDVGEHDGGLFVVFEYLQGQPLRAEMAAGEIDVRRAVEVGIQIADGVSGVHTAGFIHRGLSPDTIFATSKGRIKIPSLDLAAWAGYEIGATDIRLHHYAAPEEIANRTLDERSNTYSAASILYEMLTATRPLDEKITTPSATNPHVLRELDDVVLWALAWVPESRCSSAAILAAELRRVAAMLNTCASRDEKEQDLGAFQRLGGLTLGRNATRHAWTRVMAHLVGRG